MTEKLTPSGGFAFDPTEVVFKGVTPDYADYQKKILSNEMDSLRGRFIGVIDELSKRQKEYLETMQDMDAKCRALKKAVDQGFVDKPTVEFTDELWMESLYTSGLLNLTQWSTRDHVERECMRVLAERAFHHGQQVHKQKTSNEKLVEKVRTRTSYRGDEIYEPKISDMVGFVFTQVLVEEDKMEFICPEGKFVFFHDQDCCEKVEIEDLVGDIADLCGVPLLKAEEVSNETPSDHQFDYEPDSYTWTFYKFATRKGYVDVRWLGTSNGYYSEKVDLEFHPSKETK
jgi:hypothetical protein